MPQLADKDILDLAQTTLDQLDRLRFVQAAQALQHYEIMGRVLRENKIVYDSGTAIRRNIMLKHSNAASQTQLHAVDNVDIKDVMDNSETPWRHSKTNYGFERREMLMNRGASRIVNLMDTRRTDAMIAFIELLEDQGWSGPADSSDKLNIWGIPFWIQKSTAAAGFNGGNPSGFSDMAGINATAAGKENWKNYTDTYSTVSKSDLISKMRTAYRKIRFKSPLNENGYSEGGPGDMYRIYVEETVYAGIEDLGEGQNENLGKDIASMDGVMVFRKNPIIWIPKLDSDAEDPVYMLNFNTIKACVLEGDDLRESDVEKKAMQHNDFCVFIDHTWNLVCDNRRFNAVLHNPA